MHLAGKHRHSYHYYYNCYYYCYYYQLVFQLPFVDGYGYSELLIILPEQPANQVLGFHFPCLSVAGGCLWTCIGGQACG